MSIADRLLLGFGVVIALMVGLGAYGVSQIAAVRDATERVVERDITMIRQVSTIADLQGEMRAQREELLTDALAGAGGGALAFDERVTAWRRSLAETTAALDSADALATEYSDSALSSDRAAIWRDVLSILNQADQELAGIAAASERQFTAIQAGQLPTALAVADELGVRRQEFARLIDQARQAADDGIVAGQERVSEVYNASLWSTVALVGAAIVAAIVVVVVLRRSIIGPIKTFMTFVERVGRGELAGEPASVGPDEVGRLGVTLNGMVESLKQLAQQSRSATSNLSSAIAEIRASTQEQAAGVEEQLAAVQETAATVDEITHAGSQVTKRAQEVIATAQATAQTSADGLRAVEETARVMDAIREQAEVVAQNIISLSERTQAIGEIISTVNDISERSHLLALNAAIEAAAAGENGRSFAVVAAEMKLLADQAKEATNQVRSILGEVQRGINTSVMLTEEAVKRVAAGKERTEVSQRTIAEITARIQEGVQAFQQIVASTNQQQLGIEQVMSALQNIRQASQQTAAGTRQLNEAAGNLGSLSSALLSLAERYKV